MKDPENYVVNLLDLNRLLIKHFEVFRNFKEYEIICKEVRNISVLKEHNEHGKWETNKVAFMKTCSLCNESVDQSHDYNYCPNCGAKMDLEGE